MAKMPEDQAMDHKIISKSIESAQNRVEGFNFDSRKNILSYDDVLNTQRQSIYSRRDEILNHSNEEIVEYAKSVVKSAEGKNEIESRADDEKFINSIRRVMLQVIDRLWVDHLEYMDFLKTSVGLKSYGQQEPVVEYKKEGLNQFKALEESIQRNTKNIVQKLASQVKEFEAEKNKLAQVEAEAARARQSSNQSNNTDETKQSQTYIKDQNSEIGRNDLVVVTNGVEERTLKFKKVDRFLSQGWKLKGTK
jgi:preprotein translocase subunit SecA